MRSVVVVVSVALAIPCTSCAALDGSVSIQVDAAFNESARTQVIEVVRVWDAVAHRKLRIVSRDADFLVLPAETAGGFDGTEQRKLGLIRISPSIADRDVFGVVLHEFGHALGLRHICTTPENPSPAAPGAPTCGADPTGVMDADLRTVVFSDRDMAECRRVGACP